MTAKRHQRVIELFEAARQLSLEQGAELVGRESAGDVELHREVMALLAAHRDDPLSDNGTREAEYARAKALLTHVAPLLSRTFAGQSAEDGQQPPVPAEIGKFRIVRELGHGGMGAVYLAERREPFQHVAVKLIRRGRIESDSELALARFESEQQALAIMSHNNIARVYDAGVSDTGDPYLIMEYVKGVPITDYCDHNLLTIRERLELFRQLCAGVHYAHQKGVVHRDLKPTNVLVTTEEGHAVVKIIDFGLAKATGQQLIDRELDEPGRIVGTLLYMSPEQAGLTEQDVDTRADVYALGVILYELLVGELPFTEGELLQAGMRELLKMIREEDPPTPSVRAASQYALVEDAAKLRRTTPMTLRKALRHELDALVMKALQKDRTRRYDSAAAFGEQVRKYLVGDPLDVVKRTPRYLLAKFSAQHRATVATSAVLLLLVLGGIAGTLMGYIEASANLEKFNLLTPGPQLRQARALETQLYPAWPHRADEMRAWLGEFGDPLEKALDTSTAALAGIEKRAFAWTEADRDTDRRIAAFEGRPFQRLTWRFAGETDRLLHDALVGLVGGLRSFSGPGGELEHVRERLAWAETVEKQTVANHRDKWRAIAESIRESGRYTDLELCPQIGLVPLDEPDPESGLWEFVHLRSGEPGNELPARDPKTGRLVITGDTGIVFVLLPGGEFTMGTQEDDPDAPNYFAGPLKYESPPHAVPLHPFFLSKYEMTQGQWKRLSGGENPSYNASGRVTQGGKTITDANPVENVSWYACELLLRRDALELATEAQWEYACRAGYDGPWHTGSDPLSLRGHVNLSDTTAHEEEPRWATFDLRFSDGHVVHAPVGSFEPNDFGLHDMAGNVWEWCRDRHAYYDKPVKSGDGLRHSDLGESEPRILRGGSFYNDTTFLRSAARNQFKPNTVFFHIGVRPSRRVYGDEFDGTATDRWP